MASKLEALFPSWQIKLFQMQSLQIPIASKITVGAVMGFLKSVSSVGLNLYQKLVIMVMVLLQLGSPPSLLMPGKRKIPGKHWKILMFSCCVGFQRCSYWQHLHRVPSALYFRVINSLVTAFCCKQKVSWCCSMSQARCWKEQSSQLLGSHLVSLD